MSNQYNDYLHSEQWKRKATERIRIDRGRCQMCGSRGTQGNPLCVHHLSYRRLFNEDPETDLVT